MSYNFVRFEEKHGRYENRISITGNYSIGLPTKFYNDNKLKDYKFVVLFWDVESRAIGIQFTSDEAEKGAIKIAHTDKYGASVAVKSFFTKHDIDTKKAKGRYDWEKVDDPDIGGIFVIKIKS
jgi:hypothetical protein